MHANCKTEQSTLNTYQRFIPSTNIDFRYKEVHKVASGSPQPLSPSSPNTYTPTIVHDALRASSLVERKSPQVGLMKLQIPLKVLSEWVISDWEERELGWNIVASTSPVKKMVLHWAMHKKNPGRVWSWKLKGTKLTQQEENRRI